MSCTTASVAAVAVTARQPHFSSTAAIPARASSLSSMTTTRALRERRAPVGELCQLPGDSEPYGTTTANKDPLPGFDLTTRSKDNRLAMRLTIDNPRPIPELLRRASLGTW